MGIPGLSGGGSYDNTRLNNVRVTQSSQGKPLPVVLGVGRVHQTLLWNDGLVSWQSDQGGKGGGKGNPGYIYASNVIAALCNGSITAIGSVWDGSSWLQTNGKNDAITIQQVYAPSSPVELIADNGVAFATVYDGVYTDFGAPAATVLSGTDYAPLTRVPYGTTLTTGTYSINPASIGTFTLTQVDNNSGGNTVYTGTITGGASPYTTGASNAYIGFAFEVSGFNNPLNNGTFVCVGSTATTLTLVNAFGVYEPHAGSAAETGNTYHFAASDVGKSAVVNYQLSIQELQDQETDIIPAGKIITVGGTFNPVSPISVIYYSTSGTPGPNDMQPLTLVSGTPGASEYSFSTPGSGSSGGADFHFSTADIGQEVLITYKYENLSVATANSPNLLKFELFGGGRGQSIWPFILTGGTSLIGTQDGGQAPREPAFPDAALGYSNTAYLAYGPMALGAEGTIPDITVEVMSPDSFGGGIVDCNVVQCILQVLTNPVWGLGSGPVPFPISAIDNGADGTWGAATGSVGAGTSGGAVLTATLAVGGEGYTVGKVLPLVQAGASGGAVTVTGVSLLGIITGITITAPGQGYTTATAVSTGGTATINITASAITGTPASPSAPGAHTSNKTAWNWFAANNFFISPVLTDAASAASVIGTWLEAGACAAYMSEGLLKLVPLGTQSAAANGCTWVAPDTAVVALDDTCCIAPPGEDTVKVSRAAWQDGYNKVQIDWNNRAFQYSDELTQEFDQASINRWGERVESALSWDFITTLPAAVFAANMRLKRGMNIRNTYEFKLPFTYSYLEPTDLVEITTSSVWDGGLNNINLGIVDLPVRITKIVDNPDGTLDITCEDSLFHAGMPVIFNKATAAGSVTVNAWEDPGDTEAIMFEATDRLTLYQGDEIWMGALGQSNKWGSCRVWVSQDNVKYMQVGTIETPARLGVLDSDWADGSDPDTVNALVVDLAENSGPLDAGTTTDADLATTMCFVDGEIIAYSNCAISGKNQYTMDTYIRRGIMGSSIGGGASIGAHPAGSLFMRLDNAILKYTYDPTWRDKTIYFKFQSVNRFNNNAQELSTLTAVPFTVPGINKGTIDASTGLVIGAVTSAATAVANYDFEASDTLPPDSWKVDATASVAFDTTTQYQGHQSAKITTSIQYAGMYTSQKFYVVPGGDVFTTEHYKISGWVKGDGVGAARISFVFYDVNDTILSRIDAVGGDPSSGTWTMVVGTGTVPADAVYARIRLENYHTSGTSVSVEFDEIQLIRMPSLEDEVHDGPTRGAITAANTSYRPLTNPLTAHDDGSSCEVDVASFVMRVANGTDVSVNSGVITGLSYVTTYHIYYDDPSYSGGAVTYHADTNQAIALDATGRFYVGSIYTPVAGGADTTGNNDGGTGAQSGQLYWLSPTLKADDTTDPVTWYPANGAESDGDTSTDAEAVTMQTIWLGGFPTIYSKWTSLALKVHSEVDSVNAGGIAFCDYSCDDGQTWTNIFNVEYGTTVPAAPTVGANDGRAGPVWVNPSNVCAPDNYATITGLGHGVTSQNVKATGFGFSVPSGATITGIDVTFDEAISGTALEDASFLVQLLKAGTPAGVAQSVVAETMGTAEVGGNADLWEATWADTDPNDTNFGVEIAAKTPAAGSNWAAGTYYSPFGLLIDSNGNLQQIQVAGTSKSGSPPTWATIVGNTTVDNSITWIMIQTAASMIWSGGTHYDVGHYILATASGTPCLFQLTVNTPVSVGTATAYVWNSAGDGGPFSLKYPASGWASAINMPSLHVHGTGGDSPAVYAYAINGDGTVGGSTTLIKSAAENWNAAFWGTIYFPAAGTYSFNVFSDDGFVFGWDTSTGLKKVSGTIIDPANLVVTAVNGYTKFAAYNMGGSWPTNPMSVQVPAAGYYNFEVDYRQGWKDSNLILTCSGKELPLVSTSILTSGSAPTWPAWTSGYAPYYPTVTESSGYQWANIGPATDFSWTASTPFTLPALTSASKASIDALWANKLAINATLIDSNLNGQIPYRAGISGGGAPLWATDTGAETLDNTTLLWLNVGARDITTTFNYAIRNVTLSVTYIAAGTGSTRAKTTDTVTLPLNQNLGLVQVRYGNDLAAGDIKVYEVWVEATAG